MIENLPNEEWKEIQGYELLYQVSSYGRVKSLKWGKERILKQGKNPNGYLNVSLCKEGKVKTFLVHRLVYEAFIGEIPEGMQVNHIDENKTNNKLSNLNLMTAKENSNHGTAIERRVEKQSKQVVQYSLDGVEVASYLSANEVQRQLGFSRGNISSCCNGKRKHAYGYIWRYA